MTEAIGIVARESQDVLLVRARIGMLRMPRVMGLSYRRIMEYLEGQGSAPAGAPYCRYTGFDWGALEREGRFTGFVKMFTRTWELEMGLPLDGEIAPGAGMERGLLAGGRHVQTLHRGPYRTVGRTYSRLQAWVRSEALKLRNEAIEIYRNDPRETPPEELETMILVPLAE